MKIVTYLHAHVFKSTNAAVELAGKSEADYQFAKKLINGKQASASSSLKRIETEIPQKESRIDHIESARGQFISEWGDMSKNIGLKDATKVGGMHNPRPFESAIKNGLGEVAKLKIRASELEAKSVKYETLSQRLGSLRSQGGNPPSLSSSVGYVDAGRRIVNTTESETRPTQIANTDSVVSTEEQEHNRFFNGFQLKALDRSTQQEFIKYMKQVMDACPQQAKSVNPQIVSDGMQPGTSAEDKPAGAHQSVA